MASPDVSVSPERGPFERSEVNLRILSPTLKAGLPEVFGSGMENLPDIFPVGPVINGSPIAGVLNTVVPDDISA